MSHLLAKAKSRFGALVLALLARVPRRGGAVEPSVLVVRADEIGDLILTTPFLHAVRAAYPQHRVTLVVKSSVVGLFAACPHVDEVVPFEVRPASRLAPLPGLLHARQFARTQLAGRRFEVAYLPRWDTDYAGATFVAWWTRPERLVGFSEGVTPIKARRNRGYDRLLTTAVDDRGVCHEAARSLRLVDAPSHAVSLEVWPTEDDRAFVSAHLAAAPATLVAVAPGAGEAKRRWPVARFAEVLDGLRDGELSFVLIGGSEDAADARLLAGPDVVDLTGRSTLTETAAVLERCALFIGNDSGPMHLAAASGSPVVAVSCHPADGAPDHRNAPERFGPVGTVSTVIRPPHATPPCSHGCEAHAPHCILDVTTQDVLVAARRALTP